MKYKRFIIKKILRTFLLLALITVSQIQAFSQESDKKIDELINEKNFEEAIQLSKGLLKNDPENPSLNFKLGYCYLNTAFKKSQAIPYLLKSVKIYNKTSSQNRTALEAKFYLGKAYHKNYQFKEALDVFGLLKQQVENEKMLTDIENEMFECKNGIELRKNPVDIKITNIDRTINSSYSDHNPVVTADESVIIFTSKRKHFVGEKVKQDGQFNAEIYISTFDGKKWLAPVNISNNINTEALQESIGISADGQQLLLYRDIDNGTILISYLIGDEWSSPENLGENINTSSRETHASLSADGRKIYFTSDRPGGFGGLDIYVSEKNDNGSWGKATNLGSAVNTDKDEEAPFIHHDGITLYFSSKGHKTMGNFDIFLCKKNEFGTWTKPKNLGYPINTTEDDVFYSMTPDGKRAYFASYRENSVGNTDIFMMDLPEAEEVPLTVVKGIITACNTEIQTVQIIVYNTENDEIIGIYKPNTKTGKYLFILSRGKKYQAVYKISGKELVTENFYIADNANYQVIYKSIELKTLNPCNEYVGIPKKQGDNITKINNITDIKGNKNNTYVENILFSIKSAEVTFFKDNLSKLANYLIENPSTKIEIIGYSDSQGAETFNLILSKQRAKTVNDFLVKKGVKKEQITYKGNGEKNQITINNYDDGSYVWQSLPYNRRVEFNVIIDSASQLVIKQFNIPEVYLLEQENTGKVHLADYGNKFTIQLGTYSKPISAEHFKKLKKVQMYYIGKHYHYSYGEYISKDQALNGLKSVYDFGYKDAFIRKISCYFPSKLK